MDHRATLISPNLCTLAAGWFIDWMTSSRALETGLVLGLKGHRCQCAVLQVLLITSTDGGDVGIVYHAIGSPFHGYSPDIKPQYDISKTKRRLSRISLGKLDDDSLPSLGQISKAVRAPNKSPNPLDPFAVSKLQLPSQRT